VTDPGPAVSAIDALPSDIPSLQRAACQFVFHYRADGDFSKNKVPKERMSEIHTRYASDLFTHLLSRGPPNLSREREPKDRVVACCRDATVLFLSLARQKGIPARMRVGNASYFAPGWWIDHTVAEVWDEKESRWRLVDPEMNVETQKRTINGKEVDYLDLTTDQFLNAAQAWSAARSGHVEPGKFVVSPEIDDPVLRGLPYLSGNLICDLVSLNKVEMLLWDAWGVSLEEKLTERTKDFLDGISAVTSGQELKVEELERLAGMEGVKIPRNVTRFDPNGGPPVKVDVSRALGIEE
jgi:hypothetical protein